MQRGGLKLRRGAAFHVHHLGTFVGDDERALELPEAFRVDAEVCLQRLLELHALRNVNERSAGKHRAVESGKLVVAGRDHLAEPWTENFLVLLQAFGRVDEDHSLFGELLLHVRVGRLRIVLRLNARKERALLLGDAETLECFEHFFGHLVPRTLRLFAIGKIIADVVEVDVIKILGRPVGGHRFFVEDLERLMAELAHPLRIVLHIADVIDRLFRKAAAGIVLVALGKGEIALAAIDVDRFAGFVIESGGGVFVGHGKCWLRFAMHYAMAASLRKS